MVRLPISQTIELRAAHRSARRGGAGARESIVIALHELGDSIGGSLAVPVACFAELQAAIASIRLDDLRETASPPSGGESASEPGLAASDLTAHTGGAGGGKP